MGMEEDFKALAPLALLGGGWYAYKVISNAADGFDPLGVMARVGNTMIETAGDILATGAVTATAAATIWGIAKVVRFNNEPSNYKSLRISPGEADKIDMLKVQRMCEGLYQLGRGKWEQLWKGRVWITWRIQKDQNGKIQFYCLIPEDVSNATKHILKMGFPGALIEEDHEYSWIPYYKEGGEIAHMGLVTKSNAFGIKNDLENNIGDILAAMPRESVLELRFTPVKVKKLREAGRGKIHEIKEQTEQLPEESQKVRMITERYMGRTAFACSIILWSKHNVRQLGNSISQHTRGLNSLKTNQYKVFTEKRNPYNYSFTAPLPWRRILLNDVELANFLTLPNPDHPIMKDIEVVLAKRKPQPHQFQTGFRIAWADHAELPDRPIRVTADQLILHPVISGASGSGKGGTLMTLMDDFLEAWCKGDSKTPGFTLCDPHQVAVYGVINRLLELERKGVKVPWEKVRCFSLGKTDYPTPLNLLAKYDGATIDEIVEETAEIIVNAFPGELSKSRVMLENALHTLLWDDETHTIGEISKLFKTGRTNPFRDKLLSKLGNHMVRQWWEDEVLAKGEKGANFEALATRLNPFLSSQMMQRSYGQGANAFNAAEILEEGHLVLVDFSGALAPSYKLTAGYIANAYHRAAQARGIGKRPHFLAFDEAQLFHVPRFKDIVREDRKFGLGLMTITQDIDKLDKDFTEVLKVNCGLIVSMNQSIGAPKMASLMRGEFSESYLSKLPSLHGALWSHEGCASTKVDPPGFYKNGTMTAKDSDQEKEAMAEAQEKFQEIQRRECPHYSQVDLEIEERVTGRKGRRNISVV